MINFNTNKITGVFYPQWAGGCFVINCLSISMQAEFQHQLLIDKFKTSTDKFIFLNRLINSNAFWWNDCGIGNTQMLGKPIPVGANATVENQQKLYQQSTALHLLNDLDRNFFIGIHFIEELNNFFKVWKNAKLIKFINPEKWMIYRKGSDFVKSGDNSWVTKIVNYNTHELTNKEITFDTESFFNVEYFTTEIQKLYQFLELPDFDPDLISQLGKSYLDITTQIKNNQHII